MSKIDTNYFEGDFMGIIDNIRNKLGSLEDVDLTSSIPEDFEYYNYVISIEDDIRNANDLNDKLDSDIKELVDAWKKAERNNKNLGASLFLSEGTLFYENSAGGGRNGHIGNQYTSEGDYTINYIAIYSDGQYCGSININEKITLEEKIQQLKNDGIIKDNSDVKISQHVAKQLDDGKLGDIGWLDQISYESTEKETKNKIKAAIQNISQNVAKQLEDLNAENKRKAAIQNISQNVAKQLEDLNAENIITDSNGNVVNIDDIISSTSLSSITITMDGDSKTFKANGTSTKRFDSDDIKGYLKSLGINKPVIIDCTYSQNHGRGGTTKKTYTRSADSATVSTTNNVEVDEKQTTTTITPNTTATSTAGTGTTTTTTTTTVKPKESEGLVESFVDTSKYTILHIQDTNVGGNSQIYNIYDTSNSKRTVEYMNEKIKNYQDENGKCPLTIRIRNNETGKEEKIVIDANEQ